jgi:hypothetical protein
MESILDIQEEGQLRRCARKPTQKLGCIARLKKFWHFTCYEYWRMRQRQPIAQLREGQHVKFEVVNQESGDSEWMWLLPDCDDDQQQLVFGQSDSVSVVVGGIKRGQLLAVS